MDTTEQLNWTTPYCTWWVTGPQVPGFRCEVSGGLRLSPSGLSVGRPASPWRALGAPALSFRGSPALLPAVFLSSPAYTRPSPLGPRLQESRCFSILAPAGPGCLSGGQVALCWTWVSERRAGGAACRRTGLCTETGAAGVWSWPRAYMRSARLQTPCLLVLREGHSDSCPPRAGAGR